MLTRSDIEAREARQLAPYAMKSMDSRGRAHAEEEHAWRGAYQRDRDRVIHCTAFRRLEYKTQVFVNHEGDHYRTRLTHTIEVAQIARTIARALNLNEDLVEAVALAHDLGHTPFGHSGEDALRELMRAHGGFEHNVHGLRVVDVLEHRYPDFPGLNLSWEVRESIAKHVSAYDHPALTEFDPARRPLLEAQVVEAADAIAYDCHDLDDGLAAGILTPGDLEDVELVGRAARQVAEHHGHLPAREHRAQTVRFLINLLVCDVVAVTEACIREEGVGSPDGVRDAGRSLVRFSPDTQRQKEALQSYLFGHVYQHYRVARMAHKAKRFVKELFEAYLENPLQLPPEYQQRSAQEDIHRVLCDYIAGMTDRYALGDYRRLFEPFQAV